MKKILVTGVNSYIGNSFREYMQHYSDEYSVDGISVRNDAWRNIDFSQYDCVFDVAGIAHADVGHASEETVKLYYSVNRDLTVSLAEKAKQSGVKQFIFMSSAIVYGDSAPIGGRKVITADTIPSPANFYGDSKLQAENGILPLADEHFSVCILRPPMIYGKGSKGNYPVLAQMACKLPAFPAVQNSRSMLYIGNLMEFVRLIIKNEESGIFFPQNAEYSNTSEVVQMIASAHNRHIPLVHGFTWLLKLASRFTGLVNKAFGSLTYDMSLSEYKEPYRLYSLSESISLTEGESCEGSFHTI